MSAVTTAVVERAPRLVIEAECSTCGVLGDDGQAFSTIELVVAHTKATGHVVILNGTCDLPDEEAEVSFCRSAG